MAKTTTRKSTVKKSAKRSSDATESKPRVKALKAEPEAEEEFDEAEEVVEAEKPEAKLTPYWVELVEGTSYELKGKNFVLNRPVVVTDPYILKSLLRNGRFKCRCAVGG